MGMHQNNRLRVQTNEIPRELTSMEINEMIRAIALYHKDGKYTCQTFFTPPRIAQVNWIEGVEKSADVYFRSIQLIGTNLLHVNCTGTEERVRKACGDPSFYNLIRGLSSSFSERERSRWYLDTTSGREKWDLIVSLDKKACSLLNHVNLEKRKTRIENVIIVGDALLGLTGDGKAVMGQLSPDILEKKDAMLDVDQLDSLNHIGKIDLLVAVPNSETSFLACAKNIMYECSLSGDMIRFEVLEDRVKRIKSVDFNHTSSLIATNDGLYEIGVEELPNMVRAASLPRQISHSDLKGGFRAGHYVEDPFVLGVHPAQGIVAKAEGEKIVCF